LLIAQLHPKGVALRGDGEVFVSQLSHQVEGLSRRLLERETQGIFGDALLDGLPQLWSGAKEAVCRHYALDALMRTLEVVAVDEELRSP
jgi:hypothetical protein